MHDYNILHYFSIMFNIILLDLEQYHLISITNLKYKYWFYFVDTLCDRYGLYVVDEANIESHGMGYALDRTLGNNPDWMHAHMAVRSAFSDDTSLNFGVPQGSVLGPRKYCMFSKPIGDICKRHNMLYHGYADDTQSYLVIDSRVHFELGHPYQFQIHKSYYTKSHLDRALASHLSQMLFPAPHQLAA